MTDGGPRVGAALWPWMETALKTPPPTPQPAPIPVAHMKAKAALDALVAAIGADQQQAA